MKTYPTQGLKSANKQEIMASYSDTIVEFIIRCTQDENQTPNVRKAAVGVLGDLGDAFGVRMYQVYAQPFILKLVSSAVEYEDSRDVALWAQKVWLDFFHPSVF